MECFAGCLFVLRKRKAVYRGDDRWMRWIKGSLISLPRLPWRYLSSNIRGERIGRKPHHTAQEHKAQLAVAE